MLNLTDMLTIRYRYVKNVYWFLTPAKQQFAGIQPPVSGLLPKVIIKCFLFSIKYAVPGHFFVCEISNIYS